jgi:predicted XRE-type DNA-binding protein
MDDEVRISHTTEIGSNIFSELGFPAEEAAQLEAISQKEIQDIRHLKIQLMTEVAIWIEANHLKQADAALALRVSRPRVSDVINKKTAKFTIDTLVGMLARIGKPVSLAVG